MSFAWLVAYEPGEGAAGRADKTLDAREQQAAAVQDDGLEQLQQGWKAGVDEALDVGGEEERAREARGRQAERNRDLSMTAAGPMRFRCFDLL